MAEKGTQTSPADLIRVPERLYEGYVFDLDGTIYLGDVLLPGAKRLIEALRELGKRVIFLSNNPTKDPEMYSEKLTRLGLPTPAEETVNTVVTMTQWLLQNHPDATVFPISEEPLKNALRDAGIRMSEDPAEIDIVIASYDPTHGHPARARAPATRGALGRGPQHRLGDDRSRGGDLRRRPLVPGGAQSRPRAGRRPRGRSRVLGDLRCPAPSPDRLRELAGRYVEFDVSSLYPDAKPTLAALATRYKLGVVANPREKMTQALRRDGLMEYFDVVATPGQVGSKTPVPRMWRQALEEVGVRADRAVHVGNRLDNAIRPAKEASLHTIWLLRGEAPPSPTVEQLAEPDALVTSFSGVPNALVGISSGVSAGARSS
jgi:FMN phosphatase YigB (HAD superfamily)